MTTTLETVEINPASPATGSVIWLHGLGADGHDFEALVPELKLPDSLPLRFVFPHAPQRPITINGGMVMRGWYDIVSLERTGLQDAEGIRESADHLQALIAGEVARGIPLERIVLAGFSQGGAIALHTAIRQPEPLAGLLALSTYLPLESTLKAEVKDNANAQPRSLPIFFGHGTFDPVLPLTLGEQSVAQLTDLGFNVQWREYPMPHAVCPEEIADIREWLLAVYA